MIYRFRVILDNETKENVFRDIEIRNTDTLEDLHNVINQSFGFEGNEMASFYLSDDEWTQGEEISLFDVSEGNSDIRLMNETSLSDTVNEQKTKLIYVYDFFNMWTFYVELAEVAEEIDGVDYPNLMFVHGQIPDDAPDKVFKAEGGEDGFDDIDDEDDDNGLYEYDESEFY